MQIQNIPVKDLMVYENNPRNNDAAVAAVKQSIKDFGFCRPIVIDSNNVIVAGHTRLRALKELGWTEAPCVVIDDLTPEEINAYRLADNKTAEAASWDPEKLETELQEIQVLGIDLAPYGFDIAGIDTEDSDDDYLYECPECGYRFS